MDSCPYCKNTAARPYLKLRDEFLTKEPFEIVECSSCHLLYTVPRPSADKIGLYYKSEEYLSHQKNTSGLIPRIYEKVKHVNLKRKFQLATNGLPKGTLLDIGCGVGDFLLVSKKNGWEVVGIEPSALAKSVAQDRLGFTPLDPSEITQLPAASFDVITMWHVLEHVEDVNEQVSQLSRLLKSGGRLVIAVPNYQSYDALYYQDQWAAWDVPRHLSHFNPTTMGAIISDFGFKSIDIQGLKWDAYYVSYLSERYLGHSLPLLRGAFRGACSNMKAHASGMYSSLVYRFTK